MSIVLDGSGLTIEKIVRIARFEEKVELDSSALERIKICRTMLEEKLKAKEVIRRHVEFLDIDRPLYDDHNKMKKLVQSCEILEEVEKEVGSLE